MRESYFGLAVSAIVLWLRQYCSGVAASGTARGPPASCSLTLAWPICGICRRLNPPLTVRNRPAGAARGG